MGTFTFLDGRIPHAVYGFIRGANRGKWDLADPRNRRADATSPTGVSILYVTESPICWVGAGKGEPRIALKLSREARKMRITLPQEKI